MIEKYPSTSMCELKVQARGRSAAVLLPMYSDLGLVLKRPRVGSPHPLLAQLFPNLQTLLHFVELHQ